MLIFHICWAPPRCLRYCRVRRRVARLVGGGIDPPPLYPLPLLLGTLNLPLLLVLLPLLLLLLLLPLLPPLLGADQLTPGRTRTEPEEPGTEGPEGPGPEGPEGPGTGGTGFGTRKLPNDRAWLFVIRLRLRLVGFTAGGYPYA